MSGLSVGLLGAGAVGQAVAGALVASGFAADILVASRTVEQAGALAADLDDMRAALGSSARPRECLPRDLAACHALVIAVRARFTNANQADVRMGGAAANAPLLRDIARDLVRGHPGVVLVVTNPVDLMTRIVGEHAGHDRVYGVGSNLDSARYRLLLAHHWRVPSADVRGHVIGEHGDHAVICASTTTVAGHPPPAPIPLTQIRTALNQRPGRISSGIGRTRTGPAGAVLAALRHTLAETDGVVELCRPWRDGVWLGLPIRFQAGHPEPCLPDLSMEETTQLHAAAAKLAAAFTNLTADPKEPRP
ncbi:L-lactate dehydrogenase [Sinosporangium album]|uniref:L-lactate dehydrogenase n=1 Tax=Sinosporangium album TaxID=504805 RepID=A0A1G8KUF7_9ACTN|nr:NAD(P)-binding domain-containing protein [Sinosporangium album]SDI47051.1 L-lactate dehydrogenase [Sinosporangium album]